MPSSRYHAIFVGLFLSVTSAIGALYEDPSSIPQSEAYDYIIVGGKLSYWVRFLYKR